MSDSSPVPFEELYAQRQWVRALALRLVRDPGAADDVEQQTWIAAIEHPPRRGSVRAWLGTVVRSKAWKLRRSGERRVRHEEAAPARDGGRAPGEIVAAAEAQRRVVDAVMELGDPYRTVVLLRFFEDLPPAEITRRMGVPLETVRTRLRRAVEMLRARLDREFEDRRAWAVPILGLELFRDATRPASPIVPVTLGATLMTTKQVVLALAAVAALVLGAAVVVQSASATRPRADAARDDSAATDGTDARGRRHAGAVLDAAPGDARTAAVRPVVVAPEIDRARDLHGEVVSTEGAAIAGAVLRFEPLVALKSVASTVTTNADGRFLLRLEPGEVVNADVQAAGRARLLVSGLQPGEHARIVLPEAVRLVVSVLGSDGAPAAGVRLKLSPVTPPFTATPQTAAQEAMTDATGSAAFDALAPGADVRVNAWAAERDAPASAAISLPARGEASVAMTLTRGADIHGRVYDAKTGQGIAAAHVGLSTGIGSDRFVQTAADGAFRIAGDDPSRSSWLHITAPGFVATSVEAKAEKFAEAPLRAAVPATLRVVDAAGAPIAGALVTVQAPGFAVGPDEGFRAGADGRVRLDGLADDARGFVFASARGFATTIVDIVPKPGAQERDFGDIRLGAGGEIGGSVRRTDGSPAPRAVVVLQGGGGGMRFSDDLGRFRFPAVATGTCRIGAADGGLPSRFRTLAVTEGESLDVVLVVATRRDLRIEVVDASGQAVAGALFMAESVEQQDTKAVTDANGVAHAQVTGRAAVRFLESGGRVLCDPTSRIVHPSQDVVRFVAMAADHASGVILGADGAPLGGAQFDVRCGTRFLGRLWADAQGRFDVIVPAGSPASVELVSPRPDSGKVLDDKLFGGRIEIAAGGTGLTLRASPVAVDGVLMARVVRPDGTPVPGARVVASGPISRFEAVTDGEGRARLGGLPVRELSLIAPATGGWQPSLPQAATPGAEELTLTLRAASSVAGRVVDADARPIAQVAVVVQDAGEAARYAGTTDADGRFRVEFPAGIASPLSINVQRHSKDGFQDEWVEGVAPGASGVEIVVR